MPASASAGWDEWDELPSDGSEAWFGAVLMLGSSVVSVKILTWAAVFAAHYVMP